MTKTYEIVINGLLVDNTPSRAQKRAKKGKGGGADYHFVDMTIYYTSDDDDLTEEDIVNMVIKEYESRGERFTRTKDQTRAGLDKIQLVGSTVEESDDLEYLLDEGILEEEPQYVRDEHGRFASKTDYYRELRLNSYKSLSDLLDEDY